MAMTVTTHGRLVSVSPEHWQQLFPGHPDSYELISLIESCGMDDFQLVSIVVRENERPLLLIPLFITTLALPEMVDGFPATLLRGIGKILPNLVNPKLLGIGFVEGEWGAIGIIDSVSPEKLAAAWQLATAAFNDFARQIKARIILLLNFSPKMAAQFPPQFIKSFAQIETYPCARLAVSFISIDEYLSHLSKVTRKNMRRKIKSAEGIEIIHTRDPQNYVDNIYSLYLATVSRSELALGVQRRTYFEQICSHVSGAAYILYLRQGKLLAFNLLVVDNGVMIDKYFCMDEQAGPEYSLYFISWLENIRRCIAANIPIYHAGPGAEETKLRLGAEFQRSLTFFRHRNPILHKIFSRLRGLFAYHPTVDLSEPSNLFSAHAEPAKDAAP